jgi:hypothetical protein
VEVLAMEPADVDSGEDLASLGHHDLEDEDLGSDAGLDLVVDPD